jgi:O-antigen/teichoic acid export membrane protein
MDEITPDAAPASPRAASSLLSGAGVMLGARLIVALLGWVGLLLIAGELPTVEFGSYAFVFSLLGLLGMVADFETTRVVMAELHEWENLDELAGRFVVFRVLLSTVMYTVALAIVLIGSYSAAEVRAVALGGLSYFLGSALWSLITICQAKFWLRSVAIVMVIGQAAQLALVIAIATSDSGSLLRFVFPAVVNDAVALALLLFLLRKVVHLRPRIDVARWRAWFVAALPLAAGSVIAQMYFKIDAVMLTWLLPNREGREAIARYQIGYKFSDLLAFLVPALLAAVLPILVRARTHDAFRDTFAQALTIVAIVVAFVVPVFMVLARPVVDAFFSDELASAATPARWLVVGQALNFATQLVFITLVASNRRRRYPIATFTGLVVNVVLNCWWIPDHGVMGAAVATIVTELVVLGVLIGGLRDLPLRPLPVLALLRIGVAGAASAVTAALVVEVAPWFVAGPAAAAAFVAVLQLLGVDGPDGIRGFAERSRVHRASTI